MPAAFPANVLFGSERGAQTLAVSLFFCRLTRVCKDNVDVTCQTHPLFVHKTTALLIMALTVGNKSSKKKSTNKFGEQMKDSKAIGGKF